MNNEIKASARVVSVQDSLVSIETLSGNTQPLTKNEVFQTIKVASIRDRLTNLYNYFAFMQRFREVLETCHQLKKPVSVLMIDLDDFKKVNDTYGHLTGNHVLAKVGEILSQFFRRSDVISRYGGEEFAVVLNRTPINIALVLAENLRQEIEKYQFYSVTAKPFNISISVGVSSTEDKGIEVAEKAGKRSGGEVFIENLDEIVEKMIFNADNALYESKRRGKNRVTASRFSAYPHKEFTEYMSVAAKAPDVPEVQRKFIQIDPRT